MASIAGGFPGVQWVNGRRLQLEDWATLKTTRSWRPIRAQFFILLIFVFTIQLRGYPSFRIRPILLLVSFIDLDRELSKVISGWGRGDARMTKRGQG